MMDESKDLDLRAKRKEEIIKARNAGKPAEVSTIADIDQLIEVDNLMLQSLNKKLKLFNEML